MNVDDTNPELVKLVARYSRLGTKNLEAVCLDLEAKAKASEGYDQQLALRQAVVGSILLDRRRVRAINDALAQLFVQGRVEI